MDFESALTAGGVAVLILDRVTKVVFDRVVAYRREQGSNLRAAFETTGGVIDELHRLYTRLKGEPGEETGFHSLRLLSAHNSGNDLNKTMLWKSTVLSTYPSSYKLIDAWQEQPLDHEYLQVVLRPVVENGQKYVRTMDLQAGGPLGSTFLRQGIKFALTFLVKKTDAEIVYATATFTSEELTPDQISEIWQARVAINKWVSAGASSAIFHMDPTR